MAEEFRDKMKEVCGRMMEDELRECSLPGRESAETSPTGAMPGEDGFFISKDGSAVSEEDKVMELAEKITALLPEDQNLLYLHYCLHIPDQRAAEILGVSQAFEKRIYVEKILSVFSDSGKPLLWKACEKALFQYTAYDPTAFSGFPSYSRRFRRKLKKIRAAQKTQSPILIFARRAAVFLLVITLGFSGAMVTNAEFRQKVVEWFVETFPEFTRFRLTNTEKRKASAIEEEMKDYSIMYIPDGYVLEEVFDGTITLIYQFINTNNEEIVISLRSENAVSSYDTERADIEVCELGNISAYYWETDHLHYIVWQWDNLQFSIVSKLDQEEIIKIAKNIKKSNK